MSPRQTFPSTTIGNGCMDGGIIKNHVLVGTDGNRWRSRLFPTQPQIVPFCPQQRPHNVETLGANAPRSASIAWVLSAFLTCERSKFSWSLASATQTDHEFRRIRCNTPSTSVRSCENSAKSVIASYMPLPFRLFLCFMSATHWRRPPCFGLQRLCGLRRQRVTDDFAAVCLSFRVQPELNACHPARSRTGWHPQG